MINVHVMGWLLTGGLIGCLTVLHGDVSMGALLASFSFAMAVFILFGLIRRQPIR